MAAEAEPSGAAPRFKQSGADRVRVFLDISIDGQIAGRIVFELFNKELPKTCFNFKALCTGELGVRNGRRLHFKGCAFHRIIPKFMMQGGDFTLGNGRGGDSAFGGPFEDEGFPFKHDGRFKLSMANAGRNTNGSQFFVTFAACDWLDGKHVVFGEVAEGHEVVAKVEALGSASGRPTAKIVIADCGVVGDKSAAL